MVHPHVHGIGHAIHDPVLVRQKEIVMYRFFEQLSSRIAAPFVGETKRNSKVWQCHCGQSIFFPNTRCLACSAALGYLPEQGRAIGRAHV